LKKTVFIFLVFVIGILIASKKVNLNPTMKVGQKIDSLNNVYVYFNGVTDNINGRNLSKDGYNFGLKYQCVEFVKRYYYKELNHKMPDSYGHAISFYNKDLRDGQNNSQRNLTQYSNPSISKPKVNDLLVYSETIFNKYGHVSIISRVTENEIEIIQQNPGSFSSSREVLKIIKVNNLWKIDNNRILGWLRKTDL